MREDFRAWWQEPQQPHRAVIRHVSFFDTKKHPSPSEYAHTEQVHWPTCLPGSTCVTTASEPLRNSQTPRVAVTSVARDDTETTQSCDLCDTLPTASTSQVTSLHRPRQSARGPDSESGEETTRQDAFPPHIRVASRPACW